MLHNTWQICKSAWPRQNKSHFVEQLLEINFPFAFIRHVTGTEQDDTGAACYLKSELHFRFTFSYWECISINNFTVSEQQKCLGVIADVYDTYHRPMRAHHSFALRSLMQLMQNPADKVCEITDAPASLESDVWKHFPATRNENGGKGDGEAKNNKQTEPDNN